MLVQMLANALSLLLSFCCCPGSVYIDRPEGLWEKIDRICLMFATCNRQVENDSDSGVRLYGYWGLELVNRPRHTEGLFLFIAVESSLLHHQLHHSHSSFLCWDTQTSCGTINYCCPLSDGFSRIQHVLWRYGETYSQATTQHPVTTSLSGRGITQCTPSLLIATDHLASWGLWVVWTAPRGAALRQWNAFGRKKKWTERAF